MRVLVKRVKLMVGRPKITLKRECEINGCTGEYFAKGCCKIHYRLRRAGKLEIGSEDYKKIKECEIEGCLNKAVGRGLCMMHYKQLQRGRIGKPKRVVRICKVEGCTNKHFAKGYCECHYFRYYWPQKRELNSESVKVS